MSSACAFDFVILFSINLVPPHCCPCDAVVFAQRDEAERILEEVHVISLSSLGASHLITESVRAHIEKLRDDFIKLAQVARYCCQ